MSTVTLINPFEVAPEQEFEFVERWKKAAEFFETQQGFIESELHRSREASARFRFTNISTWETAEHFQRAIQQPEFVRIMDELSFPHYSALYDPFLHWHRDRPKRRLGLSQRKTTARAARLAALPNPSHAI